MAVSTVYDVKVRYGVYDNASTGIRNIGQSAVLASRGTGMLSASIGRLVALGAGVFGLQKAKAALIDYTSNIEQAALSMSGLLSMNLGGSWLTNQQRANKLIKQFIEDAKASPATSKDFVDMASRIVGPLTRAGGSMADLRDVTKGAVVAAKAFGIEAGMASLDIEQALGGTLSKRDRFARALLEPLGMTTDAWNKMVKETPGKAAQALVNAFNQPAVKNMAKAQETMWVGVTSTLRDNLDRALAKVGIPLMQALNKEMQKMNAWFAENPKILVQTIGKISNGLMTAFGYAKRIVGFLVEHKGTLLAVAKAYLVSRAASAITSGIFAPIGALQSLVSPLRVASTAATGFGSAMMSVAGKAQAVVGILGTTYVAANALAAYIDDRQKRDIEEASRTRSNVGMRRIMAFGGIGQGGDAIRRQADYQAQRYGFASGSQFLAKKIVDQARASGLISGDSIRSGVGGNQIRKAFGVKTSRDLPRTDTYNWDKYEKILEDALAVDRERRIAADAAFGKTIVDLMRNNPEIVARRINEATADWFGRLGGWLFPGFGETVKMKKETKVTIQRIEIASDDPDRFAFNFVGAMESIANNPVQARRVLQET